MKKVNKKKQNKNILLPIIAVIIVVIVALIIILQNKTKTQDSSVITDVTTTKDSSSITVDASTLTQTVQFVDYDSDGIAMQIMVVKDNDKIRAAYNTCQVCKGSPYAYFIQEGNDVVCQNCGNHFSISEIGDKRGGCNPVPVEYDYDEDAEQIIIQTEELDSYRNDFINWKKGL